MTPWFFALLVSQAPSVEGGIFASSPAHLETGQAMGPSLGIWWPIGAGGWAIGARGRVGFAEEPSLQEVVGHTELDLSARAGFSRAIGGGEVGLAASASGLVVREVVTKHQADRLEQAGIDPTATAWAGGLRFALEATVRLFIFDQFAIGLDAGPTLSLAGDSGLRLGWIGAISLIYTFEDRVE